MLALCGWGLLLLTGSVQAAKIESAAGIDYSHGFSYLSELKYPADFEHFDWVNPDAPRTGELRIPVLGRYDSFNYFTNTGRSVVGMYPLNDNFKFFYDSLLQFSADEKVSMYGLLAEGFYYAEDRSWYAFKLREDAYWHDGKPLTIDDVIFSFNTLTKEGPAWMLSSYQDISHVEQIGPWEIKFVMKEGMTNSSSPRAAGFMPIIPKHYWEDKDITKNLTEPPLFSGPYKIVDWRLGRYFVAERQENYWGNNVPSMRGRFNYQTIKFDYFRDDQVLLEAMRGYLVDIQEDGNPKNWNVEYDFPGARDGLFKMELIPITAPIPMRWPLFWNLRDERFKDVRVREALWLLFDFEFMNRVMYFDFYRSARSLYHGAEDMEATGLPSQDEIELLEPFRDQIPPRVYTETFEAPRNDGYGINRHYVERAINLFAEAGWVIRNGRMVNAETGEQFHIDFVMPSHGLTRPLLPYEQQLNRVGISTTVRVPEISNWAFRIRKREFNASVRSDSAWRTVGQSLRNRFDSAIADMEYGTNTFGMTDPAVDYLVDHILAASTHDEYEAAVKAVDRVIMWNFYHLPLGYLPGAPLVYWDKFGKPDGPPLERVPWADAWWYDEEKAAQIEERVAAAIE